MLSIIIWNVAEWEKPSNACLNFLLCTIVSGWPTGICLPSLLFLIHLQIVGFKNLRPLPSFLSPLSKRAYTGKNLNSLMLLWVSYFYSTPAHTSTINFGYFLLLISHVNSARTWKVGEKLFFWPPPLSGSIGKLTSWCCWARTKIPKCQHHRDANRHLSWWMSTTASLSVKLMDTGI